MDNYDACRTQSGSGDKTINGAYKNVYGTGNYNYAPTLGISTNWIDIVIGYKIASP